MNTLASAAYARRKDVLDMIRKAGAGHVGSDFSVMEILGVLYYKHLRVTPESFKTPFHDRFILSKGHAVDALYTILADLDFFPKADLATFCMGGTHYIGHPNRDVNGIEMNTGSLGHGLSVAAGMALAQKMDNSAYRTYVVMGDGELAEGSVWEGAMAAGHYRLDNLIAVIDRNGLQISGPTETVMSTGNLKDRWEAFGWHVLECRGNDVEDLDKGLIIAQAIEDKPTVLIAQTTKGCGVSFMENQPGWHHRIPTQAEYAQAMAELCEKEAAALG
jgi:transketolase